MRREFWAVLAFCFLATRSFATITGIVMTAEGQPVAGARVSIRAFESREAARARILSASPEAVPIAIGQTDAKGAFSLESPKEPTVDLTVYARGFTPVQRQIERDQELGAIVLQKGEMRKGSVNAGGKPVPGATVAVYYGSYEYLTKTDDQGRYEAPDPKRSWSIVVVHPDYAIGEDISFNPSGTKASVLQRTLVAGSKFQGRAVSGEKEGPVAGAVVLVDGWPLGTTGEDGTFTIAHMPPKWKTISARKDSLLGRRTFSKDASATIRLTKGATISGRVTDAKTRVPVGGAAITAGPRQFEPGSDFGPTAITDAKGTYSLVVPAGGYRVFASHPGYYGDPADASAAIGQQVSRDLVLSPLARVSGVVQDESNRPVVAAMLDTEDAESSRMGIPPFRMRGAYATVSGPDGRFSMRIPPDQDLSVLAMQRGMPPAKSDPFRLTAGERKTGLVLTIPNGIAVSGRTIDTHGQPLAGVAVTATEVEGGQHGVTGRHFAGGMQGAEEDAVHTASDGTFTMRLKGGTYDFAFRREGLAPKTVRGQTISASPAPGVDATMESSVDITGRVTRAGTGVENVMIMTMVADTGPASATTGPDGSFTLGGLAAGTIQLMVRKPDDFIEESRNITAPAQNVVIDVPAGGRITGRVVEKESGKPIPSFQAGITTPQARAMMMSPLRSFTSDDGSFTLDSVPPGTAVLVASASGYASTRLNVTVEDGKEIKGVELQLEMGVTLAGRVTDSSGSAVSDVQVHMFPAPAGGFASRTARTATTDADGEYSIDGLEAGLQTISFSHARNAAVQKSVTLKGRETRLDVQLPSGGRVTGTVVTESGAPVAGAQVDARGLDSQSTRTNANGAFEFESMSPGHYRFSARSAGLVEGVIEDADVSTGAPVRIVLKAGGTVFGSITGLSATELAQAQVSVNSGQFWTEGVVNAAGNYRIEGIPEGTVQVQASMGQMSASTRHSASQTVELAPGGSQQVDIAFHDGVTVRGRVTHNGVPFAGARISFLPRFESAGISTTMTGEDGQYSVDGLEDGEYNVSVADYQPTNSYSTRYQVHGSATFDFDYKTGSLHGRVIDVSSNEPLANATVFLRNTSKTLFRMPLSAVTDATGAFVVESVEPGNYAVTVRKDGYDIAMKEVTVGDSAPQDLEFRLGRNDR